MINYSSNYTSYCLLTLAVVSPACWKEEAEEGYTARKISFMYSLRGLSPNFHIHVSVSDLYIPRIGLHIYLQQNR
jgi:hypothetical protein